MGSGGLEKNMERAVLMAVQDFGLGFRSLDNGCPVRVACAVGINNCTTFTQEMRCPSQ